MQRAAGWLACALTLTACGDHSAAKHDATIAHDDGATHDTSDGSAGKSCPSGSQLIVDRTSCPGAVVAPPAALLSNNAQPGDVVSMDGLTEASLPCTPTLVCGPTAAATMLFSDDPETVGSDGVLYADTFGPGRARVYVYHVNSDTNARKFPVVVLNQNVSNAHVTIVQAGLGGPSTNYIDTGKQVAAAWLGSSVSTVVTVPAGTRVLLDATLDAEHAVTGELVHAIYDVEADMPVKISVVSVLSTEDAATVAASLPLLANDGMHDRGTFPGADVLLVGKAGGEGSSARHVRLGDGTTEPELAGKDATTGLAATLHGNYGVTYHFDVATSDAPRFAASARGGAWAGAVVTSMVAPLPTASGGLSTTTDAVWLATLSAGSAQLTMLTGGAASLPVDVVVMTP